MPSQSRETERRNFSIGRDASVAIDEFATEHNITKSKVVENAVLEYTGKDRTARIEEKVDQILETIEGEGPSPTQTTGKKKNSQSIHTDFDPTDYTPDEDRDNNLSKDELKEFVTLDEPVINPEHIDESNLPGSTKERTALIAAIVRFNVQEGGIGTVATGAVRNVIKNHLGGSDYLLDQYTDSVKQEFESKPDLEYNRDEQQYENNPWGYFPTESHRREYYQDRYDTIQEAVTTPIDEMPLFGDFIQPYEQMRQWLDEWRINSSLTELDIATDEEIDELIEELVSYREDVDDCLTAIEETTGQYEKDFSRDEAIEAVPYEQEQSESVVTLLDDVGYIADWNRAGKDMGIDKRRLVWRD
jgi:hypothetical protein